MFLHSSRNVNVIIPSYSPVGASIHVVWQWCRATELYILCWSELSQRKLSPTLATAHYSSPDNAVGLVAQCELSGYVKLGSWRQLGGNFHTDLATLTKP